MHVGSTHNAVESSQSDDRADAATRQGTVYRKSLGHYWVSVEGEAVVCTISNRLRKELVYPTAAPSSRRRRVVEVEAIRAVDPVAIGDTVRFVPAGPGQGQIVEVLPRHNRLVRRAAGREQRVQVIVANVDQVVALIAVAQPAPKWNLLDRYLAAAEAGGIARRCYQSFLRTRE